METGDLRDSLLLELAWFLSHKNQRSFFLVLSFVPFRFHLLFSAAPRPCAHVSSRGRSKGLKNFLEKNPGSPSGLLTQEEGMPGETKEDVQVGASL